MKCVKVATAKQNTLLLVNKLHCGQIALGFTLSRFKKQLKLLRCAFVGEIVEYI